MPELNLSLDYLEHRKTKRLQLRLGNDAAIYPIRLWIYVGRYHPEDGLLSGYSREEIASICSSNATSNATSIMDAMLDGFLEEVEGGFQVHDWLEHQGHLKAFRVRATTAARARWDKIEKLGKKPKKDATSNPSSNALSNEEGLVGKRESLEGKKENPWAKFREPCERIFGKPTSMAAEAKFMRLLPELAAVCDSVETLESRAARYKKVFPNVAFTLSAVLNNWNQILETKIKGETPPVEIDRSQYGL